MNKGVRIFGEKALTPQDVAGKDVLEVGALDVNGSLGGWVMNLKPKSYIATDLRAGPGVDRVLDVCDALAEFGPESFDVVFSTEMLEHVQDWVLAIENMKAVTKPGGVIVLTARAPGATRHDHPGDYWRFSPEAMKRIFADWTIELLETDPSASEGRLSNAGTFVKARKPIGPHCVVVLNKTWAMSMTFPPRKDVAK